MTLWKRIALMAGIALAVWFAIDAQGNTALPQLAGSPSADQAQAATDAHSSDVVVAPANSPGPDTDAAAERMRIDATEPNSPTILLQDAATGAPVAGLAVAFARAITASSERRFNPFLAPEREGTWTSDRSGHIECRSLPFAECIVHPLDRFHYVVDGGIVGRASPEVVHIVGVAAGYEIRGIVRDAAGIPVAGARVCTLVGQLSNLSGERAPGMPSPLEASSRRVVVSDEYGAFTIAGVPSGFAPVLMALHDDHTPAIGERIEPHGRFETARIELRFAEGVALAVRVRSAADGKPIADATVRIRRRRGIRTPPLQGITEDSGVSRLSNLLAGDYELTVRHDGFGTARKRVKLRRQDATTEVDLSPATNLAGRVVDTSGNPVEGAQVTARIGRVELPTDMEADCVTDRSGRYSVPGAPEGKVRITARKPGYRAAQASYGECSSDLPDLVLSADASVDLVVVGEDGRAIEACDLAWTDDVRGITWHERQDRAADGVYSIGKLRAGTWRFAVATAKSYAIIEDVRVESGTQQRIELRARAKSFLRGRVVDAADGNPVAGARVAILPAAGTMAAFQELLGVRRLFGPSRREVEATTDNFGRFELPYARIGALAVACHHASYAALKLGMPENGEMRIAMHRVQMFCGRVELADGYSLGGAHALLLDARGFPQASTSIAADGTFELPVSADAEGRVRLVSGSGPLWWVDREVVPGGDQVHAFRVPESPGTLVVSFAQDAAERSPCIVRAVGGRGAKASMFAVPELRLEPSTSGSPVMRTLMPGVYSVRARGQSKPGAAQEIRVTSGSTTEFVVGSTNGR